MKYWCILILSLFISFQLLGQESSPVSDKITLKTGEVYFGEIVVKTAEIVMIKASTGTRYQFQLKEVKLIEKMIDTDLSGKPANNLPMVNTNQNFSGQLEITGGISSSTNAFPILANGQISLTFGNKKMLGKDVFLGLGVGYNHTFLTTKTIGFIPVFLRIQNTFTQKKTSPFLSFDAGYSFSTNTDFGGGALARISVGIIHRLNYKTSFLIGLYAGVNSISGNLTDSNGFTYTGNTAMQNAGLKLGLQF